MEHTHTNTHTYTHTQTHTHTHTQTHKPCGCYGKLFVRKPDVMCCICSALNIQELCSKCSTLIRNFFEFGVSLKFVQAYKIRKSKKRKSNTTDKNKSVRFVVDYNVYGVYSKGA
jgi:hypothetical protein